MVHEEPVVACCAPNRNGRSAFARASLEGGDIPFYSAEIVR